MFTMREVLADALKIDLWMRKESATTRFPGHVYSE